MQRVVLFTGPSLNPDEARRLTDAMVLPPIKRGDLASVMPFDPEVIAIIDGEFYQSLAVSPKEILPFLEKGVRVYGAASMGALRAVELEKFGMTGIGRVFRLFRFGFLECDDEVALTYCPWTYEAHSEPLVNTRYALRPAVRSGILTRTEARVIVASLKETYFPERTRPLMLHIASGLLGTERAADLRDFLAARPIDAKQADARLLIRQLSRLSEGGIFGPHKLHSNDFVTPS
jgi:hypothetical protein